jgi:hypothetical protein
MCILFLCMKNRIVNNFDTTKIITPNMGRFPYEESYFPN